MKKTYLLSILLIFCCLLKYNTVQAQSCGDIYVVPNGTGTGAINSPTNIVAAINMVRQDTSRTTINMLQGLHEAIGTLKLPSHIKIYGGYKIVSGSWVKGDSTNETSIYVIAEETTQAVRNSDGDTVLAKGTIGVRCDSVTDILISDVTLVVFNFWHTWDSWGNGISMYGVYARKSTDVNLVRVKIITEAAGDGKNGYTGANGRDAEWRKGGGQVMDSVLTTSMTDIKYKTSASSNDFRAGGKGGKAGRVQGFVECSGSPLCALTPCVPELPKPAGESGGRSGRDPAFPNIIIPGGSGGPCGDACKFDCYYDTYQQFINKPAIVSNIYNNGSIIPTQLDPNPTPGANGSNGTNVRNGNTYTGQTQAAIGERREMYIPSRGHNGGDGAGGGGGGGGGAGAIRVFALPPVGIETKVTIAKIALENLLQLAGVDVCSAEILNIPGKGGNGGGGGEGGQGGEGGGGGGGNFGIYAVQNSVVGTINCVFQLGLGGQGGTGGQGGRGGLGAAGVAAPGAPLSMENWNNVGAAGGQGGNGGDGGDGMAGRIGEVYNTTGITGAAYPTLVLSQKKGCTNSVMEVVIGANDYLSYEWSGGSGTINFGPGSIPNSYSVYATTTGTLKLTSAPTSDVFNRLTKTIAITDVRSLPTITAGPANLCEKDTLNFGTATVAQRYLWKVYDTANVVVKTFTTQSGKYSPPIANFNYTLGLQVFDDCCGWTKEVTYTFQKFHADWAPTVQILSNPTYCQGLDSTYISLSGFYDTTTFHRKWSTGETATFGIKVGTPGGYALRFQFDNGCYTRWSDTVIPNIKPAPLETVQPLTFNDVCDKYPPQIIPAYVPHCKFNFYEVPGAYLTMVGGNNVYEFRPQFNYMFGQTTKTIYYGVVAENGCMGYNRAPITLNAEATPPNVYSPSYYKFYPSNSNCEAYVQYPDIITFDWCSESGAILDSGLGNYKYYPIGRHYNKYRIADQRGNSQYFYLTIDVVDEHGPYIANCPFSQYINSDSSRCGAVYHHPELTVSENCGLASSNTWVATSTPGYFVMDSVFPVGVNTVNRSYTDARGNTSTCTYTVEVRDWIRPTITCPPDTTYILPADACSMLVNYKMPDYADNCYGSTMELVSGTGNYMTRPRGTTVEYYRVFDRTRSDSAGCGFQVKVIDVTAPVFTSTANVMVLSADSGKAYATLPMYAIPTATDACGVVSVNLVQGAGPGDTAGIGRHTIIWEARDAAGNVIQYAIDLVVNDFEGPDLNCPADITMQANSGLCGSVVNFTTPVALDNDGSYYPVTLHNGGIAAGGTFPLGVTTNYYYARDAANNLGGCIVKINIIDTIAPVIDCPNDTTAYVGGNLCNVFLNVGIPIIVDEACPSSVQGFSAEGATLGLYYGLAVLPAGQHTLTYRTKDGSGNIAVCHTYINVLDTVNYTLTCEPGYTVNTDPGQCGATVIYTQPRLTPFVSETGCVNITVQGTGNGSFRPVGTSTDVYTYIVKGTMLTCSTTITVVDNQRVKMKDCGRDTLVYADNGLCGADVSFIEPSVDDNCPSTASVLHWEGGFSGSFFPIGTTRQLYYIYDNMTMVDSCVFGITVIDTVAPNIDAIPDVIVQTDQICGTVVSFTEPVGTDNSGCAFTELVEGKAPGNNFPVGTTKQSYRVRDAWGNIDTCSFNVIVQSDTTMHVDCLSPPSTHAPNGLGAVVYYQTPGNFCEGTYTVFKSGLSSGAFYPVGLNKDEYLIIDREGDTATCTITVHVFETQPPILTCGANVNIIVNPDSLVNCKAYVNVPPTIATDHSGVDLFYNEYNLTNNASDYYPIGNTQVVWKASSQGMGAQCVQFVRVNAALTTTYDTIANRQKRCSGQTIVYDPGLTIGDSVRVQWEKLAFGSFTTVSTEEVLVIENPDYFSTGGIYYLYLTSPCVQTRQLVGLFQLTVYDSPEVNIAGLSNNYCFDDTTRKQVIISPPGGVLIGPGIVDGYFYPSVADTGLHTIMYIRDTTDVDGNPNNPNNYWTCSDTARLTVRVNAYPEPTPFIAASYCVNGSAVLLDTSGSSYAGAGINGFNFNPQVAGGGTHTITRTLNRGGCSISYGKQVYVSTDIPDATILTTGPYCDNLAPQLLLAVDTGGIWAADSNAIDVDTFGRAMFTPRYANIGAVPVRYTVTRGACTAFDSIAVQVKSSHYNVPYDLPEYCLNSPPITLDSVGKRYVGPGFENNVLHPDSFADGGIKFYMIVGLNAIGCEDTVFRMYWLHGPDVPFSNDVAACSGDSVQVDLQGGFVSSTWLDNGSTDTTRWLSAPGIYALALEDTFGCVGNDSVTFAYYPKPNTGIISYGDSLQANAIVLHYQWYMNSNALAGDTLRHLNISGNALYYVALTDSNGCITFSDTINRLLVCTTKYASLFDTICQGEQLQIGIHAYTQTGIYTDTLTTAIGCDSILVSYLEVLPTYGDTINHTMCNGATYSFAGVLRSVTGTYTDTLTAANGCDSIITLQLTVLPTAANTINASICGSNSYAFNGQQLTVTGTYTDTLSAANGCDSVITLNLTVLPTASQTISASICAGSTYSFSGQNLSAAGVYKDTLLAANGCDSVLTLNLTLRPVATSSISQSICAGASFSFGGNLLTTTGMYRDTLTAANGCDSIVTLNLTVLPVSNVSISRTICNGNAYNFNGTQLSATGAYKDTLVAANGCDSIIALQLTVLPTAANTINTSICGNNSYAFNGQQLTVTGTYTDTLSAANGCDSVIILNLTVLPTASQTISASICVGSTYSFNGHYLSAAGVYKDTLLAANGCDSVLTLNLAVKPVAASSINQSICAGTSFIFGGNLLIATGTYRDTLTAVNGCDSIIILNLAVLPAYSVTVNKTICNGSSYNFNGTLLSAAGTYYDTLTTVSGCDSAIVLHLSLSATLRDTISTAICNGGSYNFNGDILNTAGAYNDTLSAGSGCDSIVTLTLTVLPTASQTISASMCTGSTYSFNGQNLTAAGVYKDTLVAANGCDSVLTLNLTLKPVATSSINQSICAGTSVSFGGNLLTTAGMYHDTLTAVNGCDSVVTLQLTILPSAAGAITASICSNSTYAFNGQQLNVAGTYTDTLVASNGCDSIVTLNLTVNNPTMGTDVVTACDSYTWIDGNTYTSSNNTATHVVAGGSVNGCDSIVTLNLTINGTATGADVVTACGSYTWIDGNTYTSSNNTATHTIVGGSINGCDSIVTLTLTINSTATGTDVVTACGSYTWIDGNTYTSSNSTATHTIVGGSANGCDSIVTLNLTINSTGTNTDVVTACGSYTWIDGNTYTSSNNTATHTVIGGSINGCDSIVTLHLTVNNPTTGADVVTACDSYTWIDGNTYTSSNNTATHAIIGGSVNGCDSVVILNLTINQAAITNLSERICAGAAYNFNGGILTTTGTYADTLVGGNNCDSIVVLSLSVDALPTPTLVRNNDTLHTQSFISYQWLLNGSPTAGADSILVVTANGNYAVIVTDANGCSDTSAVLTVTGVSINQIDWLYGVNIFPNPSKGSFTVLFSDMDEHTMYITDALGRLIVDQTKVKKQHAINLTEQAAGIYYLHILHAEHWQSYKISILR